MRAEASREPAPTGRFSSTSQPARHPGHLQFGLTVDDLRRGVSKLRNRVIGRIFHSLRLIEQWAAASNG
ncbi:hypothetical protein FRAHR75_1870004 [Frankia sp. Hr75.2]|nr:hypothetical protein FRAHR75_1870004 [Frankia sp. Hr75.2]